VPTVREPDGLAMSSRNLLLTAEERAAAPLVRKGLLEAARLASGGERGAGALRRRFEETVSQSELLRVQYAELVDGSFRPVEELEGPGMMVAAVFAGSTRLIDNIPLLPGAGSAEG
jgi:pantoate--beta-alanine ligase